MRIIISFVATALLSLPFLPAFIPLTLDEKCEQGALIVVGTAVMVTRIMPNENFGGVGDKNAHYFGPSSIALFRINEVWKRPENVRSFNGGKSFVPEYIMVPCDYSFDESPSELTAGTKYVLFLQQHGANIFHPLDPASTHVIRNDRVAKFGMDFPPELDLRIKFTPLDEFRRTVAKLIESDAKAKVSNPPQEDTAK